MAGAIAVFLAAAAACHVAPRTRPEPAVDDVARQRIVERGDRAFVEGFLWKPRDGTQSTIVHGLAPLLIEEIDPANVTPMRFGALTRDTAERLDVSDEPTVYWLQSSTTLAGRSRTRWTYAWWYAGAADPVLRGIRLTLDDDGFPVLHEILGDSSGARLVFVSPALEAAAGAAWGSSLPGRGFAIERRVSEAPDVVVMELVEPGPEPLGPFVYLDAGSRDVAALVCRCMPSRVAEITGNAEYRLAPAAGNPDALRLLTAARDDGLQRMLRLPPSF